MKTLVALLVLLAGIEVRAQEKKGEKSIFSVEWEILSGSLNGGKNAIQARIGETPNYLREIPIHPDDNFSGILITFVDERPAPAVSEFILKSGNSVNFLAVKIWFFSFIGIGAGLKNIVDFETGVPFGLRRINYGSDDYSGAAYVQYYYIAERKNSELTGEWLRFLAEIKSPPLRLSYNNADDEGIEANFFAGYEPKLYTVSLFGVKGWDRWSKWETCEKYKLADIELFGSWYAGVNIQTDYNKDGKNRTCLGVRFYAEQDITRSFITFAGKEAKLGLSGKMPFTWNLGLYYLFDF